MKSLLVIATIFLFVTQAKAADLFCEAWYQEAGQALQKQRLPLQDSNENNIVFAGMFQSYDFKVDWNRELSTFYINIGKDGKRILFTTARVPTENHPENFTDLSLPNGPRLAVNCEMH